MGVAGERIALIPTGVDIRVFRPYNRKECRQMLGLSSAPIILVPSRLSPEKGVDVFIAALARIDQRVTAVVAGDGPEEARLRNRAIQAGVLGRLRFLGFQDASSMARLYSAADLACLPSLREGWPNALMESFACGCPVVASAVGGIPDIVALTGSGLLVAAADSEGLAAALETALRRHWNRDATARRMHAHSLEVTARRYLQTCAEVLAEQETSSRENR
jgi:glycosyltransferase involved in cell wall biosynthesis